MNELPLKLLSQSIISLSDHTTLTEEKKQTQEEIRRVTTLIDSKQFSQIPSSANHISQLNEIISRMDNNRLEEQTLKKRSGDTAQKIAALQRNSQIYSISLIVAVIILIIIIMNR
jgi:hypothetical protein